MSKYKSYHISRKKAQNHLYVDCCCIDLWVIGSIKDTSVMPLGAPIHNQV